MTNSRDKGKRGENFFAAKLRNIFPDIKRNSMEQSRGGGVDLEGSGCFNFEVKHGKAYNSAKIRKMLRQVEEEGKPECWDAVLVKPHMEKSYVVMPFDDFLEMLGVMKEEGIL